MAGNFTNSGISELQPRPGGAGRGRKNATMGLMLVGIPAAMGTLLYFAVPLYNLFCDLTGYGGTTRVSEAAPSEILDQEITVRFDANVAPGLPWKFTAPDPVKVRLGEQHVIAYRGKNIGREPSLGTATFNVAPFRAGPYFSKIECFCFTEQLLLPNEEKEFTVSFFVDPELAEDPDTKNLSTMTLSYTFFNQGPEARDRYMREHKISADANAPSARVPE